MNRAANDPTRRAAAILRRTPNPRRGRHALRPTRRQRWTRRSLTGLAAGVLVAATGLTVLTPDAPVTAATTATIPASEAETIYVAELAAAGVPLTPQEAQAAVTIARTHVDHGHLIGMREQIRSDFRAALPGLTDEQVETAKVAVEHHFLAVTGRRQ